MTQPKREEARGIRPSRAEVGVLVDRLRELGRRRSTGEPGQDPAAERRIETLEQRIQHLESMLEGLQDAVDRQATMASEQISELRRRTEPEEMARALSEHARTRGL